MNLEQLANIAEILGMLVVGITLIFLTIQMRQNTRALRSSTAHTAHELGSVIYRPIVSDTAIADITIRGMREPMTLTEIETIQFYALFQSSFLVLQDWFYQRQQGLLDERVWQGWERLYGDVYQTPGIQMFWQNRRKYFSDEFVQYLDNDLFNRDPDPGYKILGVSTAPDADNAEGHLQSR